LQFAKLHPKNYFASGSFRFETYPDRLRAKARVEQPFFQYIQETGGMKSPTSARQRV
jgi:hypothetical protein